MFSGRGGANVLIVATLLIFACWLEAYGETESEQCEVRMRTESGWICGRVRDAEDGTKYASFRGVPYGKPPVGDRRFRELDPPDPWSYLRDATEEGPACPQKEIIYGRITLQLKGQSEDCIYLNLHVPYKYFKAIEIDYDGVDPEESHVNKSQETPRLPILVFIHGGGFQVGSGLSDLHGPEYLMTKDVIVVTFNYRINVFGFLSLNSERIPGNQGLRDQLMLLRWVQNNARHFGGNPDNVTLMGQSAGASCAHLLSLSKATEGLFQRVILMSGTGIPNFFSASPVYAKYVADMFLANLGINSTDPEYIHEQLIKMPLINIMNANDIVQYNTGLTSFVPVVESEFPGITRIIDDEPITLIAAGRGKDYPMIVSFTTEEIEFFRGLLFTMGITNLVEENPQLLLSPRLVYSLPSNLTTQLAGKVAERYFKSTPTLDKIIECFTDRFFKYSAFKTAEWRAVLGGAPLYLQQYSYESEYSIIKDALWAVYRGAAHVEDLTYVFRVNSMLRNYTAYPPKNQDDLMKDWLTTIVTNFMECSNPTCTKDEIDWPPVSKHKIQYQTITKPMVYSMSDLTSEQLDMVRFFDSIDWESRDVTKNHKTNNNGDIN